MSATLRRNARRSGRHLLRVRQIGGLMGPLVWKSWKTGSRTKPKITLSSGMTLNLNPRLTPSWGALEIMEERDAIEVLATWRTNQDGHGPRQAQSGD